MVMPRSRSKSIPSSTWSSISRRVRAPVSSRIRSDNVVLPWSMWAMMQKLRIERGSMGWGSELQAGIGVDGQVGELAVQELGPADEGDHGGIVHSQGGAHGEALETGARGLLRRPRPQEGIARHPARQPDR